MDRGLQLNSLREYEGKQDGFFCFVLFLWSKLLMLKTFFLFYHKK